VVLRGLVPAPELARELVAASGDASVVWVCSADGDPGLTDAVASEVSRLPEPPEVEVLVGSWDVPGARLLDLVAVMDRLRSPGGCPWDAEQTPESLVKYLLEEAYEAAEAIEAGDREHMLEELGDVLLQVAFQSRVAEEHAIEPFDIDDVAGAIVAKLVRRHPHVFADGDASTPAEVEQAWEVIKAREREERAQRAAASGGDDGAGGGGHGGGEAGHEGLLHGIPRSLPTVLAADKVLARWERTGGDLATLGRYAASPQAGTAQAEGDLAEDDGDLGMAMLALVARARARGASADALLRATLQEFAARHS
jgi:XTP/dITP diphosphohydrolase